MTLARLSDGLFPSYLDRFFEGNLMNPVGSNFAGSNSTLPAVNVKENDNEYCIDVAAPGMSKEDFKVNHEHGILYIRLPKREEAKPKPAKTIKIS